MTLLPAQQGLSFTTLCEEAFENPRIAPHLDHSYKAPYAAQILQIALIHLKACRILSFMSVIIYWFQLACPLEKSDLLICSLWITMHHLKLGIIFAPFCSSDIQA